MAQLTQTIDVATDRTRIDFNAFAELGARPVAARLKQPKKAEQAGGSLEHD